MAKSVPSALFLDYPTPKELIAFFGPAGQEEGSSDLDTPTESESSNYDSGYKTDSTDTEAEDSVIEAIRTTIANETGVPVSELTPTTAFAELGIDSLLSLTISGKLTESLKIDLSTGIFMENDNLEALSKSLGLSQAPKPKEKPKKQQSYAAAPVAPVQSQEPSQELESGPQATSNLLWGNPQTANKIVFFFPAGSGSSSSYAPLPKLESGTLEHAQHTGPNGRQVRGGNPSPPTSRTILSWRLVRRRHLRIRSGMPTSPSWPGNRTADPHRLAQPSRADKSAQAPR